MQLCCVKSRGCFRPRVRLEIRWRPDDGHAHVGSDAHGNHVFGDLFAESNARVIVLGNDIRQAVVDDDFQFDVGVVRQQCREGRPQNQYRPDAHPP